MEIVCRPMTISDYRQARQLWEETPGIGLSGADERIMIRRFLRHNSGTSYVALAGRKIVGTALCGHDSRRGYLYHLAVKEQYQNQGIGTDLMERCLSSLKKRGLEKVHLFVYGTNVKAMEYYRKKGWEERTKLRIFSKTL